MFFVMKRLLPLAGACLLAACTKDTPPPSPTVSFEMSRYLLEVGEAASVVNASRNGTRYAWTTDDGQASTDANPTFRFFTSGLHYVQLTAYNSAGASATAKKTVPVGRRYLKKIEVLKAPPRQRTGLSGTYFSGPDILVVFAPLTSTRVYQTPVQYGVDSTSFPLTFTQYKQERDATYYPPMSMLSLQEPWRIQVSYYANSMVYLPAADLTLDMTLPSPNRQVDGSGYYDLANPTETCKVRVYYDTRIQ